MNFLIIGAGNTGYAASVFLSNQGHKVFLYTRSREKAVRINENGIDSIGAVEGNFKPEAVWQLDHIIEQVTYILIFTTANSHMPVFDLLAPLLCDHHKIVIFNGNWGAFEGYQALNHVIKEKKIVISESGSMPFIASLEDSTRVNVKSIKNETTISALFPEDTDIVVDELGEVFPGLIKTGSIVETSICATNPVIHVPICVFNFARIENGHEFKFYGQGVSDNTVEYITRIDQERVAVGKKLGIECRTVLETINSYWPVKHDNLYDALKLNNSYKNVPGPKMLDHRYFDEDIPYGLVPVVKLGRELKISTPYATALVEIASFYSRKDYMANGVNMDLNQLNKIAGIN